jgi:hypothetical protein
MTGFSNELGHAQAVVRDNIFGNGIFGNGAGADAGPGSSADVAGLKMHR